MFEQNWESQCTRAGLAFAQNAVLPPYPHSMLRRQAFARPVNHLFTPGPPINVEFGQLRSACRGSRGHSATLFNIEWGSGGAHFSTLNGGPGGRGKQETQIDRPWSPPVTFFGRTRNALKLATPLTAVANFLQVLAINRNSSNYKSSHTRAKSRTRPRDADHELPPPTTTAHQTETERATLLSKSPHQNCTISASMLTSEVSEVEFAAPLARHALRATPALQRK